ncbi:bifunctional hydroxymethylpyrimidine kinase/phosphomethylpyrimidine kinase [Bifidobacterium sp. ESL0798]|uniref:bifunctional hydroxymethylpyrimidine kinase/phosphomethylpyrimidine kinase n=1 Tax=Bifidobacterium sp. ESL0798 TaxID=2983235 RepID=UPI0023F6B4A1|nr:bifunctional hydroxymethylpyrimidine kinase/phosphomethylpyrimidine kinase [Bifidobacterium sp. ESL0798]WEV74907.1 bifunctional hydroxymethylpyrimidine kinase/phosphomethylpyrimidine kinase [Bifidobacterium sp. ESL0798]
MSTAAHPYKLSAVLSIAGSDSSGGAGIQADLKTFMAFGVYGMSAITSLTAQNTTGVRASAATSPELLAAQIDAVFEDIRPDAVKIGMVPSAELIEVIAERLRHFHATNIVVDPVMIASSGDRLSSKSSIDALCTKLLPLATLVTPNIPETEVLANFDISRDAANDANPQVMPETTNVGNTVENASGTIHDEASTIEAARRMMKRAPLKPHDVSQSIVAAVLCLSKAGIVAAVLCLSKAGMGTMAPTTCY